MALLSDKIGLMAEVEPGAAPDVREHAESDPLAALGADKDSSGAGVGDELDTEAPECEPPRTKVDIFVSYRVIPDERKAEALKRLIQTSLKPTPNVFVASVGGVKPANIGLKPQLQKAVTSAGAVVALITPESKEREWLVFEAGAAWGREQVYAPVLLGVEPHELGVTIADNVATKASDREQMDRLIQALGEELGLARRGSFANRYRAFERQLKLIAEPQAEAVDDSDAIDRVFRLRASGEREKAEELLKSLVEQTNDDERKAHLLGLGVVLNHKKDGEIRAGLEKLPDTVKGTSSYNYWLSTTADSKQQKLKFVERMIEVEKNAGKPNAFSIALRGEILIKTGRLAEGVELLTTSLADQTRRRRFLLIEPLIRHGNLGAVARLVALATGPTRGDGVLFRELADVAIEHGWHALAIFAAQRAQGDADNGTSRNNLGRAYAGPDLRSLAYESFKAAAAAGVSVGRVNMANQVLYGAVPSIALEFLRDHQGEFDASDPSYPFQIRCRAEEAVADQRKKASEYRDRGALTLAMLGELAEQAIGKPSITADGLRVVLADGRRYDLQRIQPFPNAWMASGAPASVFVSDADEPRLRGMVADLTGAEDPSWISASEISHEVV